MSFFHINPLIYRVIADFLSVLEQVNVLIKHKKSHSLTCWEILHSDKQNV